MEHSKNVKVLKGLVIRVECKILHATFTQTTTPMFPTHFCLNMDKILKTKVFAWQKGIFQVSIAHQPRTNRQMYETLKAQYLTFTGIYWGEMEWKICMF